MQPSAEIAFRQLFIQFLGFTQFQQAQCEKTIRASACIGIAAGRKAARHQISRLVHARPWHLHGLRRHAFALSRIAGQLVSMRGLPRLQQRAGLQNLIALRLSPQHIYHRHTHRPSPHRLQLLCKCLARRQAQSGALRTRPQAHRLSSQRQAQLIAASEHSGGKWARGHLRQRQDDDLRIGLRRWLKTRPFQRCLYPSAQLPQAHARSIVGKYAAGLMI